MISSCSELLEHMACQYEQGYISDENGFQGDNIKFKSVFPADEEYGFGEFMYDHVTNMLFFVGCKHEFGFILCLFGTYPLVKAVTVTLPNYVRNELICTIKDDWEDWK